MRWLPFRHWPTSLSVASSDVRRQEAQDGLSRVIKQQIRTFYERKAWVTVTQVLRGPPTRVSDGAIGAGARPDGCANLSAGESSGGSLALV